MKLFHSNKKKFIFIQKYKLEFVLHNLLRNIFVTDRGDLKIGDLGYSKNVADMVSHSRAVGTLNYMSPELIRGDKNYDNRIDSW